jgi:amidase
MTTENSDVSRRSMLGLTTGAAISAAMPSTSQAAAAVRPSDIVLMGAVALSSAIHSRQVSCVEVMTAYLDHIDKLNPKVNAIVMGCGNRCNRAARSRWTARAGQRT